MTWQKSKPALFEKGAVCPALSLCSTKICCKTVFPKHSQPSKLDLVKDHNNNNNNNDNSVNKSGGCLRRSTPAKRLCRNFCIFFSFLDFSKRKSRICFESRFPSAPLRAPVSQSPHRRGCTAPHALIRSPGTPTAAACAPCKSETEHTKMFIRYWPASQRDWRKEKLKEHSPVIFFPRVFCSTSRRNWGFCCCCCAPSCPGA